MLFFFSKVSFPKLHFMTVAHKICISDVKKYYQLLYWIFAFPTVIAFINRNVARAQELTSHYILRWKFFPSEVPQNLYRSVTNSGEITPCSHGNLISSNAFSQKGYLIWGLRIHNNSTSRKYTLFRHIYRLQNNCTIITYNVG